MKQTWYCAQCGSRDIRHDGILQYDPESGEFDVLSVLDGQWCEGCEEHRPGQGDPTFGEPPEFVVVAYIPEGPEQGGVLLQRPVAGDEPMDLRAVADEVAQSQEQTIDERDGDIPNCSGDLRVEFRRDPDNAVAIFSGQSYYYQQEAA